MSGKQDNESPPAGPDEADATRLPRDVQEHLGRQLRSALRDPAEKPAYLGDPGMPSQFDGLIAKMASRERVHERGVQAVERALDELGGSPPPAAEPSDEARGGGEPE